MNKHISPDRMPGLTIGDCSSEELQHCQECPECHAEVARLQDTLKLFRDSVRHWADRQCPPEILRPEVRRVAPLRWILAAAGLLLAAAIPVYQSAIERQREAQATQAAETVEDELLFEKIEMHLSRSVPASIEPFMELISAEIYSTSDSEGEIQ